MTRGVTACLHTLHMKLLDSTESSWISTHYREDSKIHCFGCCRPRISDNKMHLQSKSGQGICMDDCWASLVQLNLSQPTWQASVSAVPYSFLNGFTSLTTFPTLKRAEVPRRSPRWCIKFACGQSEGCRKK